MFLSIRRSKY